FDVKSYLASLVGRFALEEGRSYAEALASALRRLETIEVPSEFEAETFTVLTHVRAEARAEAAREAGGESRGPSLLRSFDLADEIRDALSGVARLESPDLSVPIRELAADHPGRLLSVFREIRAMGIDTAHIASRVKAADLEALVDAWLALSGPGTESELGRAIVTHAERVQDRGAFFARVLGRLVEESLLDLEEIVSEDGPRTKDEGDIGIDYERRDDEPETEESVIEPDRHRVSPGPAREALERFLRDGEVPSGISRSDLVRRLDALLSAWTDELHAWLRPLLEDDVTRGRLLELLPERLLARILALFQPTVYADALLAGDVIAEAFDGDDATASPRRARSAKWDFTFEYFFGYGRTFIGAEFARRLVEYLSLHVDGSGAEFRLRLRARIARAARPSEGELPQWLRDALATLAIIDQPTTEELPVQEAAPRWRAVEDLGATLEPDDDVYVANAGLVLSAPYLPRLFSTLGLLEGRVFRNDFAAARAVQLLQFLATGATDVPEFQMVLNKVLCGVAAEARIPRRLDIEAVERKAIEGLLGAMIQHWGALGNTSIAGLRESFLQRDGTLRLEDDTWTLDVQERAYDMLLDRVPWTFRTIKLPWMPRLIQVDWR
ncbi:MAG: contractile injection system tape measure protein, partial [Gemmatimonadota bacterium]|nr:contractile injection system tape measure protein [Gemmatimonadota bacterium]